MLFTSHGTIAWMILKGRSMLQENTFSTSALMMYCFQICRSLFSRSSSEKSNWSTEWGNRCSSKCFCNSVLDLENKIIKYINHLNTWGVVILWVYSSVNLQRRQGTRVQTLVESNLLFKKRILQFAAPSINFLRQQEKLNLKARSHRVKSKLGPINFWSRVPSIQNLGPIDSSS